MRRTKLWRTFIEKTNEENVQLLVRISVMKNELKALEKKNDTLQTELDTKRIDLKRLKAKEHYNERELRSLKRDFKRKERNLEETEESLDIALMEKHELLVDVEYLESRFKDSQASKEQLNARVEELKEMVKELNKRRDYEHLREEVELLNGSLVLCNHREELLKLQVDALEADFKSVKDETSTVVDQLEVQLDTFMTENARVISEKDKELNELVNQLAMMNTELLKESNNDKRLAELQEQVENLREQKKLSQFELDLAYRSLNETNVKLDQLMKELERDTLDKDYFNMVLEFLLNNYVVTEKVHAMKAGKLAHELAHALVPTILARKDHTLYLGLSEPLTLLLNNADSYSEAENETQICIQHRGGRFRSWSPQGQKAFTPGPLGVSFETKKAMLRDLGSRDTEFIKIVEVIRSKLLGIAGVSPEEYTSILLQGSGTYAVEAVLTTTTPRGGKVFIVESGSYGKRMMKICEVAGIETVVLHGAEDSKADLKKIEEILKNDKSITNVAMVHCETSTGVFHPVAEVGKLVKEHAPNASFFVDAMSSFGAVPLNLDLADIDFW
ncbi:hypothetical protein OS493_005400 [Desmophyllum pertusum]|uniref:Aminotransferase class V domain-containing protein n=1 Tax=Desmophyllum pertusum TaxID=174260 RepID=A0A9W9YS58_9CNID|nr:hypothetical protein OS493_005400 [Desmophyllum pertusum]